MPLVEVDDTVIKALRDHNIQHVDRTAALAPTAEAAAAWQKLLANPKTRLGTLKAWKELNPELAIPEIDTPEPISAELTATKTELAELKATLAKEKEDAETRRREADALDTVSKGRTWLRREKKLDDETVGQVEKMMQDLGIPNYEVAFSHWRAQQPADPTPLPQSTLGRSLDWFKAQEDKPDHALMLKDPLAWRRQEIVKTLQSIRSGEMAA
jgi:hypothetical protein